MPAQTVHSMHNMDDSSTCMAPVRQGCLPEHVQNLQHEIPNHWPIIMGHIALKPVCLAGIGQLTPHPRTSHADSMEGASVHVASSRAGTMTAKAASATMTPVACAVFAATNCKSSDRPSVFACRDAHADTVGGHARSQHACMTELSACIVLAE